MRKIILVVGPTACGKTKYSIDLALKLNGEVINCDSLQVYKDLKILTSRPNTEETKNVPHKLFGYLDYFEKITAVSWAQRAALAIEETFANGKVPIVVGGTGLYVNMLIKGISPVPEISSEVRNKASKLAHENYEELCDKVYSFDPEIKNTITTDKHRQMTKAYEVFLETGKSILEFYKLPRAVFLKDFECEYHVLDIERSKLYGNINARFEEMIEKGAIAEVKELVSRIGISDRYTLFKNYSIFNAIGAREIVAYIDGIYTFDEMVEIACLNSRHYAKRQITWFAHQVPQGNGVCPSEDGVGGFLWSRELIKVNESRVLNTYH